MSDKASGRASWKKDIGATLFAVSSEELGKLARLWQTPFKNGGALSNEPRAWLNAARFGASSRAAGSRADPQDRLLALLTAKLEKENFRQSGEWREVDFDGDAVGFDPVSLNQKPDRFFYIPRGDAKLTPGFKGQTPAVSSISCRLVRPRSAEDLPEELRFDLEAFAAMRQGRLRLLLDIQPGRRLAPDGEPILRLSQLVARGGCLVWPVEGVRCAPMTAEWVNATLDQMGLGEPGPHWPSVKDVSQTAKRWELANTIAPSGGWDENGPGDRFHCLMSPEWDGAAPLTGLVTRHAARAIEWAEGLAAKDAEIRLGSDNGKRLLSRLWRSQASSSKGGLTGSPRAMSVEEREIKRPQPAEAEVALGICAEFDEAWSQWRAKIQALSAGPEGAVAAAPLAPLNIKRRIMS